MLIMHEAEGPSLALPVYTYMNPHGVPSMCYAFMLHFQIWRCDPNIEDNFN